MAWNNVLARNSIEFRKITAEDVRAVTGKPHEACIRETFVGLPEDQLIRLIDETATEDNAMIEKMGGELYPGVSTGLAALAQKYPLFIVSNCQSGYIEGFLNQHQLGPCFRDFECWGNTGRPKGENLKAVIDRNWLSAPLMIGDAEGDERAARECSVPFAFVTYGFGAATKPDMVFESFESLVHGLG